MIFIVGSDGKPKLRKSNPFLQIDQSSLKKVIDVDEASKAFETPTSPIAGNHRIGQKKPLNDSYPYPAQLGKFLELSINSIL